ncbi:MAG: hypothetical protein J6S61_01120 [Elusimicrobiaceae bacterium]|nr:hypothetical protein [Elusimicrobiaceae bacterium]
MKSTINYKVMGRSVKESKKIESLKKFIAENFNTKGKSLGIPSFIKAFGKFNDEKETLQVSSVASVKDIQTACRLVAMEIKDASDIIPCVISKNGVITIETKNSSDFEIFYPAIKETTKKEISATEFVINYINKHKEEISITEIKNALSLLAD